MKFQSNCKGIGQFVTNEECGEIGGGLKPLQIGLFLCQKIGVHLISAAAPESMFEMFNFFFASGYLYRD